LLAKRGFEPTIVDSPSTWARERARVNHLGGRAIVMIGASRMQLDVDLPTLREETGREPVQLAIDGSSFVPVLANLANDIGVTGTILVDYQDHVVGDLHRIDGATTYLAEWDRRGNDDAIPDFAMSEAWLGGILHRHLRSFSDGASPFASLALRVFDHTATPQYLVTMPDRERQADYRKVAMPQFYYARVLRNAGIKEVPIAPNWNAFDVEVSRRIHAISPVDSPQFDDNAREIGAMVRKIEQRGGKVVFIMFPRSGLVRVADERMFPRDQYWDRFLRIVQAPSLNYADVPALSAFVCPDGSHLDVRDQKAFTRELLQALPDLRIGPSASFTHVARVDTQENKRLEHVR
jgi:hypothetical protein